MLCYVMLCYVKESQLEVSKPSVGAKAMCCHVDGDEDFDDSCAGGGDHDAWAGDGSPGRGGGGGLCSGAILLTVF